VTSREEEYKRHARQCVEIAATFQDEERRATLLGQAQAWLRLAHLALANQHIAELTVQVARQRVIVKYALDTGQRSEMAESLLDTLEEAFACSRGTEFFCSVAAPTVRVKGEHPSVPTGRRWPLMGRGWWSRRSLLIKVLY
jgi:hypothetical protein